MINGILMKVPKQHLRAVELYLLHQGAWYLKPKVDKLILPDLFYILDKQHASYIAIKYNAESVAVDRYKEYLR